MALWGGIGPGWGLREWLTLVSVSTLFLLFFKAITEYFGRKGQEKKKKKRLVLILNDFFILSKWLPKSPHKNISCQRKWSVSSSMTFSFSIITISFTSNVSKIWSRIFQHERSETFILMFSSPFNKISQWIWQKIRSCLGQSEVTLIMRKKSGWRRIPCLYSIFQSLFRDICHTINVCKPAHPLLPEESNIAAFTCLIHR